MKDGRRFSSLPEGKLPIDILKPLLESISRRKDRRMIVPPEIGVDVGITMTNGRYLVVSSDPITGTVERIGWHAVNVSANDVATSGIMPEALTVVSMFPKAYDHGKISRIMKEIDRTAHDLGIVVVGGHTEITPKIKRPIIVVTCFGTGSTFLTAAMAKKGDSILMTKTAGIEGTSILSRLEVVQKKIESKTVQRAEKLIMNLSVLREARAASLFGKIHAMHDTTEGGLLGSLVEMSLASKLGFELDERSVPVDRSTRKICELLSIDPLKLIGSGSLIISCSEQDREKVEGEIRRAGIKCTRIGRFVATSQGHNVRRTNGERTRVTGISIQDELWRVLSKYGKLP